MTFELHRKAAFPLALLTLASFLPARSQTLVSSSTPVDLPNAPGFLLQQSSSVPSAAGSIEGVITDVHGDLVPGAVITLDQKGHSAQREATSDSAGHFLFANVGPGTYSVLVTASQLKTFLSTSFTVQSGEHATVPTISLAIASANTSIDVSANSAEVADEELKRETQQRIIGIIPNFYTSFIYDAAPLNTRQKFRLTFRSLTDPTAFLGAAIAAGIEQERDTFPSWGNSDAASYGKRVAAAYGDELLTRTFSYAIYPVIFHQDPRYFYMGPSHKLSTRFWHAALAGVIVRGDNGKNQLNYSHLLGSASAGAVSSVYHPASDSAGYLAGVDLGVGIAGHGVQALIREFVWPHFTTHVPKSSTGKTDESGTTKP